jgi:hypothetical protein
MWAPESRVPRRLDEARKMTDNDNRQIERDSLFVMADLRVEGASEEQRVKVRNLSAGGMMAEGDVKVQPGVAVEVNIRNIGWVDGSVAWVQDNRFGIAFRDEIDPKVARAPITSGQAAPRFLRTPVPRPRTGSTLRKL